MAWNKKALKKLFEKSIRKIKLRGGKKAFEEYQEMEKKAEAMTPTYKETRTEVIREKPIITPVITSEKDLPVKTIKEIEKTESLETDPNLLKIPAVRPSAKINIESEKEKTVMKSGMIRKIEKEQKPEKKEVKFGSQTPIILNFPNISDALKKKEVISISEGESKVRGIPLIAHKLPKKEAGKKISSDWEPPKLEKVDVRYPLIEPYAYAVIKWNKDLKSLSYTIIEPPLTKAEKENLEKLRDLIIDLLDINLMDVKNIREVQKYLKEKLNQMISDYEIKLTETEYNKILYYIYRNFLGLDKIEPLMQDPGIEDISCDGAGVPIFIFHRKYGSLKTNIKFDDPDDLNKFISKLAQRSGKHISVAEPLLDGALPDGSRLQATYSTGGDIAMRGSTFTIRKFTKDPLTIIDFMNFGTIPSMVAAYLWLAIEYRNSILVSGGTATGKTSALNALSLFLAPEAKIVSIEDTPELRLPHEHWIAKVAREGYGPEGVTGKRKGEISMFDLLKAALRERPDEIIVGEVRGAEAYVLFQGMASVRGNEEVMIIKNGKVENVPIKTLEGKKDFKIVSTDPLVLKTKIYDVKECVKHKKRNLLYKIKTKTGREVTVTGDHSLFTIENKKLKEVFAEKLKKGDPIAVPAKMPSGFADINYLDLTELSEARILAPNYIKKAVEKIGWQKAGDICGVKTISDYYKKINCSALKSVAYKKLLKKAEVNNSLDKIKVKFDRKSKTTAGRIKISPELLRLIGYYISEGSLNTARKNNRISLYNSDPKVLKDMKHCIKTVANVPVKERTTKGFGECTELSFSHKVIFELLNQYCSHGSKNKKIPDFVFGLRKEKISELLSALYTGNGYLEGKAVQYSTTSKKLAKNVQKLLLCFEIISSIYENKGLYRIDFYNEEYKEKFEKYIKPINKKIKHRTKRNSRKKVINDLLLDEVKEIKLIELKEPEHVYDLCVPETQNFISGGVLLHNTGHAGLATIHAASIEAVINRLTSRPINLSAGLLQHLDIVMIMGFSRIKGIDIRRVKEIIEIIGVDEKSGKPITNTIFRWIPAGDYFEFASDRSYILNEIIEEKGIPEKSVWEEIQRRMAVLEWMKKENIRYYEDVGRIVSNYYKNPDEIIKKIQEAK